MLRSVEGWELATKVLAVVGLGVFIAPKVNGVVFDVVFESPPKRGVVPGWGGLVVLGSAEGLEVGTRVLV